MKDLHYSHLDMTYPEQFHVNTWLSEIHKDLAGDSLEGDVFFLALAFFNATEEGVACFETQEQAYDRARKLGMDIVLQHEEIAMPFPVYIRVRKGRIISTGMMGLVETLSWLDSLLQARRKTMVLRFVDKQCQNIGWYSVEGDWGDEADLDGEHNPELVLWLKAVQDAVGFDRLQKKTK